MITLCQHVKAKEKIYKHTACTLCKKKDNTMAEISRISATDAKHVVDSNLGLLVCIYDDVKFNSGAHLEGAIPMSAFEKMKPDLDKDTNIIFY